MKFTSKDFWDKILCKVVETLTSVKVWVVLLTTYFCFWLSAHLIAAQAWASLSVVATIYTGVIAAIVMMREGFKMSLQNNKSNVCDNCKETMGCTCGKSDTKDMV